MFTDMVGYTALGQKNEALSLALLEEQRKVIRSVLARHNGREVKTIGDAFLIEFPNAVDAVRCAYDIQRAVREFNLSLAAEKRIHLRVGVHVGEIVESQGDISGDAVNVASRIQPLAEDGGVCITRQVYDFVKNKLDIPLSSLGPKSLKNVAEPVEVYKMEMPWEQPLGTPSEVHDKNRIAVLPFSSMSPDPNDEYFADGITEELISTISKVRGFRVIARTSAMHYKGQNKRVSEIAHELGVATVLEGSVRKAGERVRITAQLIDAPSEEHLWAEDYDRRVEDFFEIQKEIATRIAGQLKVKLLQEEKEGIGKRGTASSSAYTQYLKGRFYWSERTAEGLRKAKEYFEKAIKEDPSYAQAYSGLADTYSLLAFQSLLPSESAIAQAKAFAERAIQLDGTLAEAHTSLAYVLGESGASSWEEAEREYRAALRFNPSYATGHLWYAIQLVWQHRYEEAIEQSRQAEELDPLSPVISMALGQMLMYSRRYSEAVVHLERKAAGSPDSVPVHFVLGLAYHFSGQFVKAEEEERAALALAPEFQRALAALGSTLARLGRDMEAREILEDLRKKGASLSLQAMIHIELGETEKAMELLTKAYSSHENDLGWINVVPVFDPVRNDPRFVEIVRGMNLPTA